MNNVFKKRTLPLEQQNPPFHQQTRNMPAQRTRLSTARFPPGPSIRPGTPPIPPPHPKVDHNKDLALIYHDFST